MRLASLRTAAFAALALVLASCTSDRVLGPSAEGVDARLDVAGSPSIIINEIMPDPRAVADADGEWFEVYNASAEAVDLQGWRIASANDAGHTIAASVVVPAGGYAVLGRNANTATNGGVTLAYSYNAGTSTLNLANGNTDWLALRNPAGASVDSVHWGTSSPPSGASRGLVGVTLDNTVMSGTGTNWATQTTVFGAGDRGTPGVGNDGAVPPPPPPPPTTGALVFNEVMMNPSAVLDAAGEWFEIHNRGTTAVDVQGWTVASNNDAPHTIATTLVIPAGGYAVFARNGDAGANGGVTATYVYDSGETTINLSNTSDYLALRNPSGTTVDSVAYSTNIPNGASRSLTDPASDNTNVGGAAWFNSTAPYGDGDRGTPGAANNVTGGQAGVPFLVSLSVNTPRSIPVGYTKPAFPTVRDGVGAVITPLPTLAWSSSDVSVATVDARGYILGTGVGTATIRATTENGVTGTTTITVIDATAPTAAVYRNHVEFGTPVDLTPSGDVVVAKPQFTLGYSESRGAPSWVSWNLNATQFGDAPRCDCFSADQALPSGVERVVDFDYRNSGYDRGHMVQSESRTTTLQENASTFLLTNIVPQAGENNQGPWSKLEQELNRLVQQEGKEVYVVAGGEYAAAPPTLKNEGRVQIPDYTWKVAVVVDAGEGLASVQSTDDLRVIAVRMPNLTTAGGPASAVGIRNNPWEMYETTVDAIEAAVGYDLLAALPNGIELLVESNDRPPSAAVDGPYAAAEGAAVHFSAAASTDPDGDALTYEWSFGDGATATGVSPTHTYADNGNYTVTVTVTDPFGATSKATTTATIVNVAPAVAAFPGALLLPGETYLATGSFADPGADSWTATVNYGDGSGVQPLALSGTSFNLGHTYTASGTFTVTVTVTDDDGDSQSRSVVVTVETAQQGVARVAALVAGMASGGNANALNAKLNAATASLDGGNALAAANQLGAFIHQVEAMVRSGRLSAAQGQTLVDAANRVIASIGG